MTLATIDGSSYADGGVRANVPVVKALFYAMEHGISDIDVIVNKPRDPIVNKQFQPDGILKNLLRLNQELPERADLRPTKNAGIIGERRKLPGRQRQAG